MLTNHTKLIAGILLGLILIALLCVNIGMLITSLGEGSSQAPVRRLRITIDESQRQELFDRLHRFANKHSFEFTLSDYGSGGELYLVEILGKDIKFLASITRADPKIASIGVYAKSPGDSLPDERLVEDLLIDLRSFVSEIPNVTITEEK